MPHTLTAHSSALTIREDGSLRFTRRGNYTWQADGPLFMLHYYDRQHPRAQVLTVPEGDGRAFGTAGTPSLSARSRLELTRCADEAILARMTSADVHLRIHLRFTICADGQGFDVAIGEDGVHEGQPSLYRVLGLELLPEFGAAVTGEEGYLTLPNWFGCRTRFDKDYPREVRQTVYSSNDQWEHNCHMPVFGITRAQGTLCGLIAKGDYDAQFVHRVHWEKCHANSTHPHLVYRWEQQDERIPGPREVRYRFGPPPPDAGPRLPSDHGEGYVFVGLEYRKFLRAERGLMTWADKERQRPEAGEYLDRFFLKIFMAYKDPQEDGLGTYHPTTTFDEAREILAQCKARGMDKLCAILVGWGQDGHDGMPPTRFPVDERLGGEAGLRALNAWCREQDIMLGVHDSYGASYPSSPEHNTDDLIRHRSGEYWQSIIWSGGRSHTACPAVWLDKYARRDIPAVAALGLHGHHHIDAVGSFMTCFSPDHPLTDHAAYCRQVAKMFELAIEHVGSVSTELPFGPYFSVVDGFFHSQSKPAGWHQASPVGRHLFDDMVPLLSVVLHGSVKCCEGVPGDETQWLRMLALGLFPQAEVSMRRAGPFGIRPYAERADELASAYAFFHGPGSLQPRLARLTVEGSWEFGEGVSETLFSDGTRLRVDLNNQDFDAQMPE